MSRLQKLEVTENGYICDKCNLYNDILTVHCRDCNSHRSEVLHRVAVRTIYLRDLHTKRELMADKESKLDKFEQFFNSGKIRYSSMAFEGRREWREQLAEILLTARANLSAADWVDREESSKLDPSGRQWLESNNELTGTDALTQPKIRKERMTKADKLREQMISLGLDMGDVKSIMSSVEKNAKESNLNNLNFKKTETVITSSELCRVEKHSDCTGRFRNEKGSHECDCSCHKVVKEIEEQIHNSPDNPPSFDASKLKFGG